MRIGYSCVFKQRDYFAFIFELSRTCPGHNDLSSTWPRASGRCVPCCSRDFSSLSWTVRSKCATGAAMSEPPYDPRAIANLLLDEADSSGVAITNLALQKLLYFVHGMFLTETKQPLVSGYFEAWQYGPVHPAAYRAFKAAGDKPIHFRATRQDALTGNHVAIAPPSTSDVRYYVQRIMFSYGRLTPGRLVEISHAKNAPWHFVVDNSRTSLVFSLRIPDDVIASRFKHHKVPVGERPLVGEPSEDTPFA